MTTAAVLLAAVISSSPAAAAVASLGTEARANQATLRAAELADWGRGGYIFDVNNSGAVLGALINAGNNADTVLWQQYTTPIDLRTGSGGGQAMNNYGDAIGNGGSVIGSGWLWRRGWLSDLRHPAGQIWLTGINDQVQVVGNLQPSSDRLARGFLWQDGHFIELNTPAGLHAYPQRINNRGDILGYLVNQDWSMTRTFVWRAGVTTVLDTLGGNYSTPTDINNEGQVIGWSTLTGSDNDTIHPFLWDNGRVVDLMAGRDHQPGYASDINDAGDVVGTMDNKAYRWRGGTATAIGPPDMYSYSGSINEAGDVAGTANVADETDTRVFLWRAGRLVLSPTASPGQTGLRVSRIDNQGRIVGSIDRDFRSHPTVWAVSRTS